MKPTRPIEPVAPRDDKFRDSPNKKDGAFKDALDHAKKQREQKQ